MGNNQSSPLPESRRITAYIRTITENEHVAIIAARYVFDKFQLEKTNPLYTQILDICRDSLRDALPCIIIYEKRSQHTEPQYYITSAKKKKKIKNVHVVTKSVKTLDNYIVCEIYVNGRNGQYNLLYPRAGNDIVQYYNHFFVPNKLFLAHAISERNEYHLITAEEPSQVHTYQFIFKGLLNITHENKEWVKYQEVIFNNLDERPAITKYRLFLLKEFSQHLKSGDKFIFHIHLLELHDIYLIDQIEIIGGKIIRTTKDQLVQC